MTDCTQLLLTGLIAMKLVIAKDSRISVMEKRVNIWREYIRKGEYYPNGTLLDIDGVQCQIIECLPEVVD